MFEMNGWGMYLATGSVCLLSSVLFLLYKQQSRLIYFPQFPPGSNRFYDNTPNDFKMPYKDIHLTTDDGMQLHIWLMLQEDSKKKPTIIHFHGNAGNIAHRLPHAAKLYHKLKANIVLVSYRGYGISKGNPSEEGFKLDAKAVIDYLYQHDEVDGKNLILYGASIGGAVSIAATVASPEKVKALILENTFTTLGDMVDVVMPILSPFKFLLTNPWASKDLIGEITAPILFVSGRDDELVPPSMMDSLKDAAKKSSYVQMIEIPDGTHNDSWFRGGERYYAAIREFLAKIQTL